MQRELHRAAPGAPFRFGVLSPRGGPGAAGAGVVSALFGAPDITAAARELRALADAMAQDS